MRITATASRTSTRSMSPPERSSHCSRPRGCGRPPRSPPTAGRWRSRGGDPGGLRWAPDGAGIYYSLAETGTSNVYFAGLRGGARKVTDGQQMLSLASIARDLTGVGTLSDPDEPGDVVRFSLRKPQPITRLTAVNADVLARMRLGRVEEVWYTSSGGARVEGWIVKPPGFDLSKKYPLILEIHGGPHGMY